MSGSVIELRDRVRLVIASLACAIGCQSHKQPTPKPEPEPAIVLDCGQASTTATGLPAQLAAGMIPIGEVTLHAGESASLGPAGDQVSLQYAQSAWIGTVDYGHRGEALIVEIDDAQADGGPYGTRDEIRPNHDRRFSLGPYRFDVHMSAAPVAVQVEVSKRVCPDILEIEQSELPLWFWVSSEGVQVQSFESDGGVGLAVVVMDDPRAQMKIETYPGWQWLDPRPGETLQVRAAKWLVTIDEVQSARSGALDGFVRKHARVKIEAAPNKPAQPRTASTPCGAASPTPTELPPRFTLEPSVVEELRVGLGTEVTTDGITLALTREPSGLAERFEESETELHLRLTSEGPVLPSVLVFSHVGGPPQFAKYRGTLLRLDADAENQVRVRRLSNPCAGEIQIPELKSPTYVWLSTMGPSRARVGPSTMPMLTLELFPDDQAPSLSIWSEDAVLSRTPRPEDVGEVFSFDGINVEVVDVLDTNAKTGSARWDDPNTLAAVHVQLRIAPE